MTEKSRQEMSKERMKQVSAGLLARYIRLVFATSRRNKDYQLLENSFAANEPLIIGGWHGTFLLAPVLMPHPEKVSAVVARHGDAELIGLMLERFGVRLIRGAGAGGRKKDRGGMFALRMSLRELRAGRSVAMTADVPPGPARQAGIGIITIARMSGRPILPVGAVTSRFRVLNTWSRFVINLPFSKLVLLAGEPVHVPKDASRELMEEKRLELETKINELMRQGHERVGADIRLTEPPRVGAAPEPGLMLKTYRGAMRLAQPLAGRIIQYRAKRGKEELSRKSERFGRATLARPQGKLVWFHAASVGETNAVLPLIEQLLERRNGLVVLLTTGTVTSARIAARRLPSRAMHQFIPFDTPQFMQRFFDHWQPDLAVLVESEIWPNLVLEADRRAVPLVLVNAIMSQKSFRGWRRRASLSRPLFGRFTLVLVQNELLQKRFMRLGTPDVRAVGNLKFDAPLLPVDPSGEHELASLLAGRPHFLAASTHKGEEEQIFEAHSELVQKYPDLLTLLVPRHPERGDEIAAIAREQGLVVAQRSKGEEPEDKTQIYIADTLGELGLFFSLSRVVFLGASLVENGGHNPIEPSRFGCAVITGPYWHNQADIFAALLKAEGAVEVRSATQLAETVDQLLADDGQHRQLVANAGQVVDEMTGALERTLDAIAPLLPEGGLETTPRSLERNP